MTPEPGGAKKAAIIGGGVIGGGWAARFLLNGWSVSLFDPAPDAEQTIHTMLHKARRSLPALYDTALPEEGRLTICNDVASAVQGVDWVQESVPEQIDLKHNVLADILANAGPDCVVGSSTSGFKPSALQEGLDRPENVLVCHPFSPVYLLPLVEVVPSQRTSPAIVERCVAILSSIGMRPLVIDHEIDAHIADRLLEAMWREALWLVRDGVATTGMIDDSIRYGFGLRFAQMGLFENYRIAGGSAGMAHFMAQFGPALKWPWSKLTDVPELTGELIDRIAEQTNAQSPDMTSDELDRQRDDNLVAIMRILKKAGQGVGNIIKNHKLDTSNDGEDGWFETVCRQVPVSWTDYNGHMNEAHYLEAFCQATDRLLEIIGAGPDYVAAGRSYFTVESHIRHLAEVRAGARLRVQTQILAGAGKKLHLFHTMETQSADTGNWTKAATGEHMLIHVDLKSRAASLPHDKVESTLGRLAVSHARLPRPDGAGRAIRQSSSS